MINNEYVTPETVRAATGAVHRRQPIFHRRRRSAAVLRRRAAACRLLLRYARQRPRRRLRRVGPLLRPRALRLDARRALPPAVRDAHVPVLGERRRARRRADHRLGPVVPEPRRARRPDRARPRAGPRGPPDGQQGEAAGVGPVVARRSARKFGGIVTSATYSGTRSRNIFTFIFGNRRPDGTCCLVVPGYSGTSSWPISKDARPGSTGSTSRRSGRSAPAGEALGLQLHLHAGQGRGDRRRSIQPRLPDGRGLSALPDQHRRASPRRHHRDLRAAVRRHRQRVHHARVRHALHDHRPVAGRRRRIERTSTATPDGRISSASSVPNAWAYRSVDMQLEKAIKFGGRAPSP